MKLLVDAGNSRLKWAWWDGAVLQGVSAVANAGTDFSALWKNGQNAGSVWIASVASAATNAALAAAVRDRFGIEPVFATTRAQACGVRIAYAQPDNLGVDRFLGLLAARAQTAGAVEQAAGRRVSLLTPDEAQKTLTAIDALPIDTKAQALNQLGQAFGNAGRIADLAAQWKEKSPAMALALKAGAADVGGKPLLTTSGAPLSTFILTGAQALKDKTVKIDEVAGTGMRATIANAIGDALPPEQADDAKEAAYFIAAGSAARGGRTQPSSTDVQNAISGATGGISTTGGQQLNGKPNIVAMPYGWRDEDFQSAVKQVTAANIENPGVDSVLANGHEIPIADFVKQFASYRLVRVGIRGTYAVSTGSKFVTDKTGTPVTVHLTFPTKNAQTGAAPAGQSPTMPFPGGM